jgi:ABC-2 type transport system ATP-binding protein
MALLVVEHLKKTFFSKRHFFGRTHAFTAIDDLSFELKEGEILGFLGSNGAGKTTTIQMLLGLLTPTAGTITYFGKNFAKHRSEILESVTFASTYVKLPSRLTVWENLNIFARLNGVPPAERNERLKEFLTFFGMWNFRNKEVGTLSAGQITRVMLAKAFIPHPAIVLLDEPTAALDPDIAREVRAFVVEQKREWGLSVLFTSHNMNEVTQVCDRVLVLQHGKIIADSTPIELANSVSSCHVNLMITDGLKRTIEYAQQNEFPYKLYERSIEIEIDEQYIAELLSALASKNVTYSQISIDKPTLEDYFLTVLKREKR